MKSKIELQEAVFQQMFLILVYVVIYSCNKKMLAIKNLLAFTAVHTFNNFSSYAEPEISNRMFCTLDTHIPLHTFFSSFMTALSIISLIVDIRIDKYIYILNINI